MFIGNSCNDCSRYNRLEMKNVDQNMLAWLEDIIEENNSRIERKEWKSKYNSYVVYDYEPFCSDGFIVNFEIQGIGNRLTFISYLYEKRCEVVNFLNKYLQIPTDRIEPSRFKEWLDFKPVADKPIFFTTFDS